MDLLIRLSVILALMTVGFVICASAQATGKWKISVNTPVGADEADFVFKEIDGQIEGSYSGILGSNKPLKGSYKDRKVSISFEGEWPADGSTVEVKVTGQLSGDAGSGEVVVVNRTEGTWTARRVKTSEESKPPNPAPEKPAADAQAQFDRLVGEWTVSAGAAATVEAAIRRTTEPMGALTRGIARGRLSKFHAPPARIRMQREAEFLTIEFEGFPARRLPISGAETQQGESKQRLQWIDEAGGALRQIIETQEGKRENLYRIGDRPQLMTMSVTASSPRLPGPLEYTIEFTRAQPAAVPRQLQPNSIPAQSQSDPNFGDRFVSRDRDAPRREALQSIQVFPHLNALLGGAERLHDRRNHSHRRRRYTDSLRMLRALDRRGKNYAASIHQVVSFSLAELVRATSEESNWRPAALSGGL